MIKIAIAGKMGAGKSYMAQYIASKYREKDLKVAIVAFSDGVYTIARQYFGMKDKNRSLLQAIGTKMREINPNVWINATLDHLPQVDVVIVEDCRFQNEFDALIGRKFNVVKLNISEEEQRRRRPTESSDGSNNHASELEIDKLDEDKCALVLGGKHVASSIIDRTLLKLASAKK